MLNLFITTIITLVGYFLSFMVVQLTVRLFAVEKAEAVEANLGSIAIASAILVYGVYTLYSEDD